MSEDLMGLLPGIKRARDFYLYDGKGNRYLDLYLDGGRAICGHRPNGLSNTLKNALSRGIYAPYPSVYQERLIKVLRKGFPRFTRLGIYSSLDSFYRAAGSVIPFSDPAMAEPDGHDVRWRPYLPVGEEWHTILVSLPYPGIDVVAVLSDDRDLPPSDRISPVIQAGLVRSWFDLQDRMSTIDDTLWSVFDKTGNWKRKGPYLQPLCSERDYPDFFRTHLDSGFLISPEYGVPSICAVEVREGSLKKIPGLKQEKDNGQ